MGLLHLSFLPKVLGGAAPFGGGTTSGFGAGARSHVVESAIRIVRGTWTLSIAEEMVDARPSTLGKGAVEETVDIKAGWLILYLRPVSMSPGVAAPVVGGQVVSSVCYRGCGWVVGVRAR